MKRITSRHNPTVARFRAAAHQGDRHVVLLDGPHLVLEAVEAGIRIRNVLVAAESIERPEIAKLLGRLPESAEVAAASASVLRAASPLRTASPIVALADLPDHADRLFTSSAPRILIACDVQDPGNVGALVRVAEAAGASGLIAAGGSAFPFGWKALRGSMGSALRVPILVTAAARDAVTAARRHGCQVVATTPRGGHSLFEADLDGAAAFLIGGEGQGLSDELVDSADVRITIPMQPPVESLNAAVTAALVLYEARRRRSA